MNLVLNHNIVTIVGTIEEATDVSLIISVKRLSGKADSIMVCLPYRNKIEGFSVGDRIHVIGALRSYRQRKTETHDSLHLFVEAKHIKIADASAEDENLVNMTGYITRVPEVRTTPLGKTIADINISCQHRVLSNGRLIQDSIPCIAWNNVAESICQDVQKNQFVKLFGRIEERHYIKDEVDHCVHELSLIAATPSDPVNGFDKFLTAQEEVSSENKDEQ